MIHSVADPMSACHGCQCGMARISMVAKTGAPRKPSPEQGIGGVNRWIVAHVLVHREHDPCLLAAADGLRGFTVAERQWFLSQDAFHCAARACGSNQLKLMLRGNGNVQNFDGRIVQQFLVTIADAGDGVASRHLGGFLPAPRCDGTGIESQTPVADEMAIVDDKSAAENPYAEILSLRRRRRIAQLIVRHID